MKRGSRTYKDVLMGVKRRRKRCKNGTRRNKSGNVFVRKDVCVRIRRELVVARMGLDVFQRRQDLV